MAANRITTMALSDPSGRLRWLIFLNLPEDGALVLKRATISRS
jgi:hypothetical protein